MTSNLKSATSVTLASMCILRLLVASEAMVALEAMVACEVRYELVFEISNLSYPGINVHIASFSGLGGHGNLGGYGGL